MDDDTVIDDFLIVDLALILPRPLLAASATADFLGALNMLERLMPWTATTTLAASIIDSQISFDVASPLVFPADGNFRIRVEDELILVTAVSGSTWTVQRGVEGTTAANHNAGTPVYGVLSVESLLISIARANYSLPIRLDYVSDTSLAVNTFGGRIAVNPLTGDSLDCVGTLGTISNAGLNPSTLSYVYFNLSTSTVTASETSPDITDGIDHLPGDESKLLIGWFCIDAAGLFAFDDARSLVCSRHNQRQRPIQISPNADVYSADDLWHATSVGTTPTAELWFLQIPRNGFVRIGYTATLSHSDGGAYVFAGIGFSSNLLSGQPDDPDTTFDCQSASKVDSATEQVSQGHCITDIAQTLGDSDAAARRAAMFVRGELTSSSSTVTLWSNPTAPDEFWPFINAIVAY